MSRNVLGAGLGALALLVVIGVVAAGARHHVLEVRTARVSVGRFEIRLPETGQIQRPRVQILSSLVNGNVGDVFVHPGQRVATGQLLATIVSPQLEANEASARAEYEGARSRALKIEGTLPLANTSSVQEARVALQQAESDLASGTQSGLGYGGSTAQEQRLAADAEVARTQTALREAQRIAGADEDLFANKAISRDALDQAVARLDDAKVAADDAVARRAILTQQLKRNSEYLHDRVAAQRDALRQAQANQAATRPELAAAKADVEKASADYDYAQLQLARTQIRAPFSGIVQRIATEPGDSLRPIQPGDPIGSGEALVTVASDAGFIVRARVDEQDVASVALGQNALVSGDALAGHVLPGRVTAIGAVAQRSDDPTNTSRQVLTTVTLERSLSFLRDGMTVDVDIITTDMPHALSVPNEAIRREGGATYVYVVRGGVARRTRVYVGPSNDSATTVRGGISPNDVVVDDQNAAIRDGIAIAPGT